MIKLEKTQVVGFEPAIRGMRNPMNSWEKSDSDFREVFGGYEGSNISYSPKAKIGPNDHDLMMRLATGGSVHAKYRRMIVVYVDITAPLYWWKEFDTYKVGTVANSCSTMHKIQAKEFALEDFSHEHLIADPCEECFYSNTAEELMCSSDVLQTVIEALNYYRIQYLAFKDEDPKYAKQLWWQMIQLLPSSYNQKRTVMLNYEVLAGIYHSRKGHKLDEWHDFCDWIKDLPNSEVIIGE